MAVEKLIYKTQNHQKDKTIIAKDAIQQNISCSC